MTTETSIPCGHQALQGCDTSPPPQYCNIVVSSGKFNIFNDTLVRQKNVIEQKILHNLSKSNSCGENFDKFRKILLTNLCFGANYQNFVWKKELNVFVRKISFPKKLSTGTPERCEGKGGRFS
jgi:hypothetical protein